MIGAVAAVVVALCAAQPGAGGSGGAKIKPEPVPFTASQVLADLRRSVLQGPIAERLTVTVKQPEHAPVSANIVLRIAPGKEQDQRDARVSIEAGTLRIFARGGTAEVPGDVTAVTTTNAGAYYRATLEGPPTLKALSGALLPLPLPTLAFGLGPGDGHTVDPTPLTRGITWEGTRRSIEEPFAPLNLAGAMAGKPEQPVTLALEYQGERLRMRSFTAPLTGAAAGRTITVLASWMEPGDPASWPIDVSNKTKVESLAALGSPPPPPPPAPPAAPVPEAEPSEPKKDEPKPEPVPTPAPKRGPEP